EQLQDEPQPRASVRSGLHPGVVDSGRAGVLELRGDTDLAQEPLAVAVQRVEDLYRFRAVRRGGGVSRWPQPLDRDAPAQALVVAVVDLAHAAAAEQPVYPVTPREQFRHASPRLNTPVSRAISARSRASASSRAGSVMIRYARFLAASLIAFWNSVLSKYSFMNSELRSAFSATMSSRRSSAT